MTTFCIKSVDHCKRLATENEGKLHEIHSSLCIYINFFENYEVQKVNVECVAIQVYAAYLVLWDLQDLKVR